MPARDRDRDLDLDGPLDRLRDEGWAISCLANWDSDWPEVEIIATRLGLSFRFSAPSLDEAEALAAAHLLPSEFALALA